MCWLWRTIVFATNVEKYSPGRLIEAGWERTAIQQSFRGIDHATQVHKEVLYPANGAQGFTGPFTDPLWFAVAPLCVCAECYAKGAIMLTASHMPWNANGLKFFTSQGGLDKADISAILQEAATVGPDNSSQNILQMLMCMPWLSRSYCSYRKLVQLQANLSIGDSLNKVCTSRCTHFAHLSNIAHRPTQTVPLCNVTGILVLQCKPCAIAQKSDVLRVSLQGMSSGILMMTLPMV